ncbi:MAG: hypothetical protein RLZZ305_1162 [Actinomycetota bacterium]|jgi:exopolyphosphatase/guanosine-5'-triphosphate,3'-diphosphate pyrophosphatase
MTVGAFIDVGTNSTNLLVTDGKNDIARRIVVTRLGEGLHSSGSLSPVAIGRTAAVVAQHADTARLLGAGTVTIVGTAACRRARNTSELVSAVHDATGLTLEVIPPEEEARLSFIGATTGLPRVESEGDVMVVDIGGGSTEISIGTGSPRVSFSIPVGAVTATESDLTTDPPRPEDLTNVIGAVQDELEEIGRTAPGALSAGRVVGVAGTFVTVAAVEIGLAQWDDSALHGFELSREAAEDVFRTLATESLADRKLNPGLPPERADVIVAGCCILVGVMRRLRLESVTVSTRGLLDGLALRGRIPG